MRCDARDTFYGPDDMYEVQCTLTDEHDGAHQATVMVGWR